MKINVKTALYTVELSQKELSTIFVALGLTNHIQLNDEKGTLDIIDDFDFNELYENISNIVESK